MQLIILFYIHNNYNNCVFILENTLRKKWKYLRDQFAVELGKLPESLSGEITAKSKWPYFDLLIFLRKIVKVRQTRRLTHVVDSIFEEDVKECVPLSSMIKEDKTHSFCFEEVNIDQIGNEEDGEIESKMKLKRHHSQPSCTTSFKKRCPQLINSKKDVFLDESKNKEKEFDDDELFFQSLLPHVRKISVSKKMKFRIRIQELVDEFVYQEHASSFSSVPSSNPYSTLSSFHNT